jgi:hypothetical protein
MNLKTTRFFNMICSLAVTFTAATGAVNANSVQTVPDPTGNNFIQLLGINNSGTIAGTDNNNPAQAFTLNLPAAYTTQNFPGSVSSMATGINGNGDISGIYTDAAGNTHGFVKIAATFTTVDNPISSVFNQALGINNSDTTVGYYAPTQAGLTNQVAYSQSGGVFTDINHLLASNVNSQAVGINNAGNIVGFFQPTSTTSLGFLDVGGSISTLDPFGSTFTQALGINSQGEVVGLYTDAGGVQHGYIDNNGSFSSFDPNGSTSTTINGVNDKGQIVGFYTDANANTIGFVGTVPEPGSVALLAAGWLGLSIRRQKLC